MSGSRCRETPCELANKGVESHRETINQAERPSQRIQSSMVLMLLGWAFIS